MKILLLSEFFPLCDNPVMTGGVEVRNFFLAKYLHQRHELTVLSSKQKRNIREKEAGYLKRISCSFPYGQSKALLKRQFFSLACIFFGLKVDFDVIDASGLFNYWPALLLGFLKKKPVFFWYADVWVGSWLKKFGWRGIFGEIMERLILFFGRRVNYIAISEYTKTNLINRKIDENRIMVIPLGVDEEEITTCFDKFWDLIVVNRLVEYKNTVEIVNALRILSTQNKQLIRQVAIIGDGEEKSALEEQIAREKLNSVIKIISGLTHSEVIKQISLAKIFVSASLVEGFGIAPVEAAACGLPCILKNIPPYAEHAENLKGCVLYNDAKDLAEKIKELLENKELFLKLSAFNLRNSRKYFWRDIASQTEEYYLRVKRS